MITAIVHINTSTDRIPETAQAIAALPEVDEVYSVTGDWDLIALVRVSQHEDLADVVSDKISKMSGVMQTRTTIAFKTYSSKELEQAYDLGLGD